MIYYWFTISRSKMKHKPENYVFMVITFDFSKRSSFIIITSVNLNWASERILGSSNARPSLHKKKDALLWQTLSAKIYFVDFIWYFEENDTPDVSVDNFTLKTFPLLQEFLWTGILMMIFIFLICSSSSRGRGCNFAVLVVCKIRHLHPIIIRKRMKHDGHVAIKKTLYKRVFSRHSFRYLLIICCLELSSSVMVLEFIWGSSSRFFPRVNESEAYKFMLLC